MCIVIYVYICAYVYNVYNVNINMYTLFTHAAQPFKKRRAKSGNKGGGGR